MWSRECLSPFRIVYFVPLLLLFTTLACRLGSSGEQEAVVAKVNTTAIAATSEEILIPAGPFEMGCVPGDEWCFDDEKPLHEVYLEPYFIDKFEVTNARYAACVGAGGCEPPHATNSETRPRYYGNPEFDTYPVLMVSWRMADAYCRWEGKRLPSEAEWQKAARGTSPQIYPWGEEKAGPLDCGLLNFYSGNEVLKGDRLPSLFCQGDTTEVGSYPEGASPYGVMDMGGNVWEWASDWYSPTYYLESPERNPTGPDSGRSRITMGGSWADERRDARVSNRPPLEPHLWGRVNGFRCVRTPAPGEVPAAALTPLPLTPAPVPTPFDPAKIPFREEVPIVAGTFQMGCSPDDLLCDANESPLHEVSLDDYYIDKYEVTNARYGACVLAGDCTPPKWADSSSRTLYFGYAEFGNYPVINVDWFQAESFCLWDGKRLPSEAEWEKAARGSEDARIYPWGNMKSDCERLNYDPEGPDSYQFCTGDTVEVGSYSTGASTYGVMNMAGNVKEWVNDWYVEKYDGVSPMNNPVGPASGDLHILRGGSWMDDDSGVRVSGRSRVEPDASILNTGFRCARTPPSGEAPFPASTPFLLPIPTPRPTPLTPTAIEFRDEILIPSGTFRMGCGMEDFCDDDEMPLHRVHLDKYFIDKFEVTNARYAECVEEDACTPPHAADSSREQYYGKAEFDNYPVVRVDWKQAAAFCTWEGKRLPTEAEWEKAARGSGDERLFPWGDVYPWGGGRPDCTRLNFDANGCMGDLAAVGSYPTGASPFDLMDMGGNVWEWVNDWYGEQYYVSSRVRNPTGPDTGEFRVLRGGSWQSMSPEETSVSNRGVSPLDWDATFGFRCARTP